MQHCYTQNPRTSDAFESSNTTTHKPHEGPPKTIFYCYILVYSNTSLSAEKTGWKITQSQEELEAVLLYQWAGNKPYNFFFSLFLLLTDQYCSGKKYPPSSDTVEGNSTLSLQLFHLARLVPI